MGSQSSCKTVFFPTCEKRTENLRVEKLLLAGCEPAAKRAFEVSIQVGWKGRWSRLDKVHTCASRHGYRGALGMTSSLASAPRGCSCMFSEREMQDSALVQWGSRVRPPWETAVLEGH